jgi:hypothetical protein
VLLHPHPVLDNQQLGCGVHVLQAVRTLQVLGPCSKTQYYCAPLCLPKPCTDPTSIVQLRLLAKGAFAPNVPPQLVTVLPDPDAFNAAYSPDFPIPQVCGCMCSRLQRGNMSCRALRAQVMTQC